MHIAGVSIEGDGGMTCVICVGAIVDALRRDPFIPSGCMGEWLPSFHVIYPPFVLAICHIYPSDLKISVAPTPGIVYICW